MTKKHGLWMLMCVLCGLLLSIPVVGIADSDDDVESTKGPYQFEGTWRALDTSNGSGGLVEVTHIGGRHYNVVSHWVQPLPAGISRDTAIVGTAERVGPGKYDYTMVMYRVASANGLIGAVAVISGTWTVYTDGTADFESMWSVYTPDQDPWAGDDPAFGCFGPYLGRYARISLLDPCEN